MVLLTFWPDTRILELNAEVCAAEAAAGTNPRGAWGYLVCGAVPAELFVVGAHGVNVAHGVHGAQDVNGAHGVNGAHDVHGVHDVQNVHGTIT